MKAADKLLTTSASVHRVLVLISVTCALSLTFIDFTVVAVALPTIQRDLHASAMQLQWVMNAYVLMLAILVVAAGKLGDIKGHRKIYNLGAIIFTLGSLGCSLAPSPVWLIVSRALQGLGGVLISTPAISFLAQVYPEEKRSRAIGITMGVSSLFLFISPLLGGIITERLGWRFIFWINLPLGLLTVLIVFISPKHPEEEISTKERFDSAGAALLAIALTALILAITNGKDWGWGSWHIQLALLIAVFGFLAFGWVEKRVSSPLIDFNLLKKPDFLTSGLIGFFTQILLMANVFWMVYLQQGLHYSPAQAGWLALPCTLSVVVFSLVSGVMIDKWGFQRPLLLGTSTIVLGFILMVALLPLDNYFTLLPGFLGLGIGAFLVTNSCREAALACAEKNQRGMALGIFSNLRQIGGTFGLAILGAFMTNLESYKFALLKNHVNAHHLAYHYAFAGTMIAAMGFSIVAWILSLIIFKKRL